MEKYEAKIKKYSSDQGTMQLTEDILKLVANDDFYEAVLKMARQFLHSNDAAIIYFYDNNQKNIGIKSAIGLESNISEAVNLRLGQSFCNDVFAMGESLLLNDPHEIKRDFAKIVGLLKVSFLEGSNDLIPPVSIMAIPIRGQNKIYGVVNLLRYEGTELFNQSDMSFWQYMASLISLRFSYEEEAALKNALHKEIDDFNIIINTDENSQKYALWIDGLLDELLLKGKDFQGIMEFSADKVDFGIVLYNLFMEVLCCSNYEGDKNLPANIMEMSEMKILSRQKIPQVINISRNRQILLFPVISGERLRGFLSAQVPEKGFTAKDRIFLDYLCQAFALIWLRKIAFEEAEQKLKNEILTGLLEGNYGEDIQKKAGSYGLHNNNMSFVMMISVENVEDHHLFCQERKGAFLLNFINNYLDQKGIANIIIPEGNDICIIASYKELKRKNNRYDNIITEIMDDIYGQFPYLMLGSGRIYPGLFNIRTSYMEAGQCMVIINKYFIHRKMVSFGDMGVMRLLLTQKKEDVDAYLLDILGPIIAYDKKKNTNLMETLFYYCRLNKSLNYVSQKLNIHANTLYLRIKKAEELMGMDLENSMDWLDIQSASILYGLMYTDLISKL